MHMGEEMFTNNLPSTQTLAVACGWKLKYDVEGLSILVDFLCFIKQNTMYNISLI